MGQRSSSRNLHWLNFMLNGFQASLCLGGKDNEQKDNGLAFMESPPLPPAQSEGTGDEGEAGGGQRQSQRRDSKQRESLANLSLDPLTSLDLPLL